MLFDRLRCLTQETAITLGKMPPLPAFDGKPITPKTVEQLKRDPDKDVAEFFHFLPQMYKGMDLKTSRWLDSAIVQTKKNIAEGWHVPENKAYLKRLTKVRKRFVVKTSGGLR